MSQACAAPLEAGRRPEVRARHVSPVRAQGLRAAGSHCRPPASAPHRPASRWPGAALPPGAASPPAMRQRQDRSGAACDGASCARDRERTPGSHRRIRRQSPVSSTSTASWQMTRRLSQLGLRGAQQQPADARAMHLDAQVVDVRDGSPPGCRSPRRPRSRSRGSAARRARRSASRSRGRRPGRGRSAGHSSRQRAFLRGGRCGRRARRSCECDGVSAWAQSVPDMMPRCVDPSAVCSGAQRRLDVDDCCSGAHVRLRRPAAARREIAQRGAAQSGGHDARTHRRGRGGASQEFLGHPAARPRARRRWPTSSRSPIMPNARSTSSTTSFIRTTRRGMLLHHVRLAADRGVRVRLLVDDLNTAGEDRRFMHLSEHANVEVRVFNPFPGRPIRHLDPFLGLGRRHPPHQSPHAQQAVRRRQRPGHHRRAQHRRRNTSRAIRKSNFIDLDVVAAGPIVPRAVGVVRCVLEQQVRLPDRFGGVAGGRRAGLGGCPWRRPFRQNANWLGHELRRGQRAARRGCPPPCLRIGRRRSPAKPRPRKRSPSPTTSRR